MKKKLVAALLCTIPLNSFAVTPVVDVKSIFQLVNQIKQTAAHYKKEITHWKDQMNTFRDQEKIMSDQFKSMTGQRNVGDIDGQLLALKQEMDGIDKHRELLNSALRSSDPAQNQQANEILNKYQMFDFCKNKGSQKLGNLCKEEILNRAATIEVGETIRKQTNTKIVETSKLAEKAKNSKDAKESQDIANAIALKEIEINQLKYQWDSLVSESQLREKLIEEKKRQAFEDHQINAPLPNIQFE